MTTIHFFGKPDTFEIYEGSQNGYDRIFDSFIEPEIKIENRNDFVIKRFIKNGFSYLQLYSFAQSYNSGRGGIVIGVGLKSDRLSELNIKNFEKLEIILNDFKLDVLNDIEFKENTLANYFNTKKNSYQSKIQEITYNNEPIPNSSTQSLLLYLDDINKGVKNLPKEINGLKSIYIVSNLEIFKSNINSIILHENSNKIYTLSNQSKIVEYKEEISNTPKSNKPNHKVEQDEFETKKLQNDVLLLKSKYVNTKNEFQGYKSRATRRIQILSALSILFFFTTVGTIIKQYYFQKEDNQPLIENQLNDENLSDTQTIKVIKNIDTLKSQKPTVVTPAENNNNFQNTDSVVKYKVVNGDNNIGIILGKLNKLYEVSVSEEKFANDNKLIKDSKKGYRQFKKDEILIFKLK